METVKENRKIVNMPTFYSWEVYKKRAKKLMNVLGKNILTKRELKKTTRRLIDNKLFSYLEKKPKRKIEELYIETVNKKPPNWDENARKNLKKIFTPSSKGCVELWWNNLPISKGKNQK